MKTKRSQSLFFVPVLLTVLMLVMAACQPQTQAEPLAGPDPTAVAASVEAYFESTSTPSASGPTAPAATDEPKVIEPVVQVEPLLPAPLYFISDQDGVRQIWRIEMNAVMARP